MQNNLRQCALYYYNLGFNITHITLQKKINVNGDLEFNLKEPSHEFQSLEIRRQSLAEVLAFDWEAASGIGAVMGFNNIRSIDIDGCNKNEFIFEFLDKLGLPRNYEWVVKTGSGNGFQIIVDSVNHTFSLPKGNILSFLPRKENESIFHHLELRWINHIVLPPSLHISGKTYKFLSNNTPQNPPETINISLLQNHIKNICIYQTNSNLLGNYCENFISDTYAYKYKVGSEGGITYKGLYKEPFYLFIDIETNGLPDKYPVPSENPDAYPEIIQIATLLCDATGKRIKQANKYILSDEWEIRKDVKLLLGIDESKMKEMRRNRIFINKQEMDNFDTEELLDLISPEKSVVNHLEDLFFEEEFHYHYKCGYIVGHNLEYDLNCLEALYYRCIREDKYSEFTHAFNIHFRKYLQNNIDEICTMKSTTEFVGIENNYGYKYPKLEELHFKIFNRNFDGAHDARIDVFNTAKCYWKLRDLGVLPNNDLRNFNKTLVI